MYIQSLHVYIVGFIIIFEVHISAQQAVNIGAIVNLSMRIDSHTSIKVILRIAFVIAIISLNPAHTGITRPGNVPYLAFQVGYTNTEVIEFIRIFASELVNGSSLFRIELIFVRHEAGDNLRQFITGNISLTTESAVRIAFYDSLVGQLGYRLVCPVRCGDIRKWICCVCGYASSQSCYGSYC